MDKLLAQLLPKLDLNTNSNATGNTNNSILPTDATMAPNPVAFHANSLPGPAQYPSAAHVYSLVPLFIPAQPYSSPSIPPGFYYPPLGPVQHTVQNTVTPESMGSARHETTLPHAFTVGTLHDPTSRAWNMDTEFNICSPRDNNCTIEFDAFGFFVKDFLTRRVLLRCDSTGDLYPVTAPSPIPHAFLLGKHVRLPFVGSSTVISSCFDIIYFRYKDRLVANGSTQLEGVDVDETFSLVVKSGTIRTILSLPASRHWPIHQLDVKNVFLHGDLSKTGLLQRIIGSLHQEFAMTDLGPLNYFLGISVTRDSSGLFLSQKKYAIEILEKAHMVSCNPSRTPVDTESKLGVDGDRISDPTLYRSLADWASCPTTRRSTSGYCVFLGNNLLSWSAKRHSTLSQSSAEAEYHGVANVVAETCWLRNLLCKLHTPLSSATLVYCDNVRVLHVPSRYQFANIFTKGLPSALFEEFRSRVYEESFSRHAAWIEGMLIQLMQTTIVPEQVKTHEIQAGVQVSRLEDKDVIFSIGSALEDVILFVFVLDRNIIQRISLTGFPAQSVGSSNTDVLDSPCLLVLITGTSQSRQHGLESKLWVFAFKFATRRTKVVIYLQCLSFRKVLMENEKLKKLED
ncbi:ribonuclease H-like domain-containing protein [Tanacetum coccineum]